MRSKVVVSKIGNPLCQKSSTKVDVVDVVLISCFGVIKDVIMECFGILSIFVDLHVIPLKGPSYSLVLVRPSMQDLNDWSNGIVNLSSLEGLKIFDDMRLQRVIKCAKEKESSTYNSKKEQGCVKHDESSLVLEESMSYVV